MRENCALAELAKFAAGVRRAGKRNTSARKALPLFQHLALHPMQIIVSHFTHLHLNNFPKVIPSRLCRRSLSFSLLQHAQRETKTFAGNFYCYDGAYTDKRGKQNALCKNCESCLFVLAFRLLNVFTQKRDALSRRQS